MPRAYLITVRTDLDNAQLLLYELRPDTLHRVPSQEPPGQTRYIPRVLLDSPLDLDVKMDGSSRMRVAASGLAAWALDNIENQAGGKSLALLPAQAQEFSQKVRASADAGLPLRRSDLNTLLNTVGGVAGSVIGEDPASRSTGTAAAVLQVLEGSVYEVPAGAEVAGAGGIFPMTGGKHVPAGAFRPDLPHNSPSYPGTWTYQYATMQPGRPPAPRFPTRNAVPLVDTGELRISVRQGELSKLVNPLYYWRNPRFTYGYAGTARTLGGQPISGVQDLNPYRARAVVVYDADGLPIT